MNEAEAVLYKAKLLRYKKHVTVPAEGMWWIDRQLEEMEQEKQKNRSAKRSSLRSRLRNLVMSIIQQSGHGVKGVERNI